MRNQRPAATTSRTGTHTSPPFWIQMGAPVALACDLGPRQRPRRRARRTGRRSSRAAAANCITLTPRLPMPALRPSARPCMRFGKKNEMFDIDEAKAPPPMPESAASATNTPYGVVGIAQRDAGAQAGSEQQRRRDGDAVAAAGERDQERVGDAERRAAQAGDRRERVVAGPSGTRNPSVLHPHDDDRPEPSRSRTRRATRASRSTGSDRRRARRVASQKAGSSTSHLSMAAARRHDDAAMLRPSPARRAPRARAPCCRIKPGACSRMHALHHDVHPHQADRPRTPARTIQHVVQMPGRPQQVAEDDRADEPAQAADHADDAADDADVVREVVGDVPVDGGLADPHQRRRR